MTISTINNGDSGISVRGKLNQAISKLNTYPDTTTDNQIPRFDGAGGGLQGSQIAVSDTGGFNGRIERTANRRRRCTRGSVTCIIRLPDCQR